MAVLQFEINRQRVDNYERSNSTADGAPDWKYKMILRAALSDTIRNGGTFVVVVTDDTITAVQYEDAKPLEASDA